MSLLPNPGPYSKESISRASSVFDGPTYGFTQQTRATSDNVYYAPQLSSSSPKSEDLDSYLIISGGTGCNAICSAFPQTRTCYVLPVSDDGGSSSEIIRVIGGPSIGDIRSRLIRLIPNTGDEAVEAIRNLLAYRFPSGWDERKARDAWRDVVEGRSVLWKGIPPDRKELIRGFLVYFESEVLKRSHKSFAFRNGSIGNFFLSATQLFFRSLPSAIFQFSAITGSEGTILPVLVTNHTVTIAAQLSNKRTIIGQCNISHPIHHPSLPNESTTEVGVLEGLEDDQDLSPAVNFQFQKSKDDEEPLESGIERVFYINAYGQEIYPSPNPDFISNIHRRSYFVYSCGSLWTSIIPCLALRGVATAIAQSPSLRAKILLLNFQNDRETSGYTALDYINSITNTLNRHDLTPRTAGSLSIERPAYPASAFITHLVYLTTTKIKVERSKLAEMGIQCIRVNPHTRSARQGSEVKGFDADIVEEALKLITTSI